MKKRNFILISTIVCALVTLSLVTYTLVDLFVPKKGQPEDVPVDNVAVDTNVDLENQSVEVNLLVGDEYSDMTLTAENYTGTLLKHKENNVFVADKAGSESFEIQKGNTVFAYTINVYEQGDGSKENPYIIVNPSDLIDLVKHSTGYAYYQQKADLDLSEYDSWVSLGTLTAPFIGSYDGGSYEIKNMQIVITPANVDKYIDSAHTSGGVNGTMLTTGFFGFVGDVKGNEISEVKNINISQAHIDTTAIEDPEERSSIQLTHSYVGVLAGYAAFADVTGNVEEKSQITSTIYSSLYCDNTASLYGAVSGLIGGAFNTNISGFAVVAEIEGLNPGTVEAVESDYKYYGSTFAGLVGFNQNTNITDCDVELSVEAKNYQNTVIAGAVGYIKTGSTPVNITIKNINVLNLYVRLARYSNFNAYAGIVAGAVNCTYNEKTTIENVHVVNAFVSAVGTGQVSGIINTNNGTVINSSVSGILRGSYVAGIAYENKGSIIYTSDFARESAVAGELRGQVKVGGVAIYNFGKISGSAEMTRIDANLSWSVVNTDFEKIQENCMIAGIAVVSAGENSIIENFYTATAIEDAVNAAGAVGYFGSWSTYQGGTIKNLIVNTTIRTISGKVGAKAYTGKSNNIGGIVAVIVAGEYDQALLIENVSGIITVNDLDNVNSEYSYGLNVFGTVAAVVGHNVTISNDEELKIQVELFTNYTSAVQQLIGTSFGKVESGVKVRKRGVNIEYKFDIDETIAQIVEN